jgi:hypothetical protein
MTALFRAAGAVAAALALSATVLLAGAQPVPAAAAQSAGEAQALEPMVQFDALYIPLLSLTSAAQSNPGAVPKTVAAATRLRERWPALKSALAANPPSPATRAEWRQALTAVERQLAKSDAAVAQADWKSSHNALEEVRIDLMKVRQAAGFDYFVDRLTAYHEPMEVLALAGANGKPEKLDAAQRAQLEKAFAESSARWRAVEQNLPDARVYHLTPAREAQLRKGLVDEAAAMSRLSDALRGSDDAALLKAAGAIKPPFSRVFTAFGAAEGETVSR